MKGLKSIIKILIKILISTIIKNRTNRIIENNSFFFYIYIKTNQSKIQSRNHENNSRNIDRSR